MLQTGAYSRTYQESSKEKFELLKQTYATDMVRNKSKEKRFSQETVRRQKALANKKQMMGEAEEKRRKEALMERKKAQEKARLNLRNGQGKVQLTNLSSSTQPRRKAKSKAANSFGKLSNGAPDRVALFTSEGISDMLSGAQPVVVPSLDEMLAQLRRDEPRERPVYQPNQRAGTDASKVPASLATVEMKSLKSSKVGLPKCDSGSINEEMDDNCVQRVYAARNYSNVLEDSLDASVDGKLTDSWAEKVNVPSSLSDSLEPSPTSSAMHLSEPVLDISKEFSRLACGHSEVDVINLVPSASKPSTPTSSLRTPQQLTSILKKSGQKNKLQQLLSEAIVAHNQLGKPLSWGLDERRRSETAEQAKHVRFAEQLDIVLPEDVKGDKPTTSIPSEVSVNGNREVHKDHFKFAPSSEFQFRLPSGGGACKETCSPPQRPAVATSNSSVRLPSQEEKKVPLQENEVQGTSPNASLLELVGNDTLLSSSSEEDIPESQIKPQPSKSLPPPHQDNPSLLPHQDNPSLLPHQDNPSLPPQIEKNVPTKSASKEPNSSLDQIPSDEDINRLFSQVQRCLEENRTMQESHRVGLQKIKLAQQKTHGVASETDLGSYVTSRSQSSGGSKVTTAGSKSLVSKAQLRPSSGYVPLWRSKQGWKEKRSISNELKDNEHASARPDNSSNDRYPKASYSHLEPVGTSQQVASERKQNGVTLSQEERRLMESIERLNVHLKMKPFFQETASLIQEPTSLPRSSASLKPVKAQTVQPKAQGSKRSSGYSGKPPQRRSTMLDDLPRTRVRRNPHDIALAADKHALLLNSRVL